MGGDRRGGGSRQTSQRPPPSTAELAEEDVVVSRAPPPVIIIDRENVKSPPRPRQQTRTANAAPAADNRSEQPLGQALAPKKAPPPTSADSNGNAQANAGEGSSECNKSSTEICEWVRTLPESHVPERSRENIISIVEQGGMSSSEFSDYLQCIPSEVCAPKHAMKLKSAWKNVLA